MIELPSAHELAREAREVIENNPETSAQHLARLIKAGFINARGQVTWLLGGDVDPEPPPAGPDEPYVRED
jgi:hypothetical protein